MITWLHRAGLWNKFKLSSDLNFLKCNVNML